MVEFGPVIVRRETHEGILKVAEIIAANAWNAIPCPGTVDLALGQYGPRTPIVTSAGTTSAFHSGVDISAWYGVPVRCIAPGEVVFSGYDGAKAQVVVVRHDDGTGSVYVHMDGWMVPVGKRVVRGEILGYVGSTGMSTGPHLHFMRTKHVPVPYPEQYYWYDQNDLMDPFGPESGFVEVLSQDDPPEAPDYILGAWPKVNMGSLVVTTQDVGIQDLLSEAGRSGVALKSVFLLDNGIWRGYLVGAPDVVNQSFPNPVPGSRGLFVRA